MFFVFFLKQKTHAKENSNGEQIACDDHTGRVLDGACDHDADRHGQDDKKNNEAATTGIGLDHVLILDR